MSERWDAIARDSLRAAEELTGNQRFRSAVSRAYFAVFAAITHELERMKTTFPKDWEGPAHGSVVELIASRLVDLSQWNRQELKKITRRLLDLRHQADYHRKTSVAKHDAVKAIKDAIIALKYLRIAK